jgi:hypothetical protein
MTKTKQKKHSDAAHPTSDAGGELRVVWVSAAHKYVPNG